jgi:predicted ATPase
MRFAWEYPAAPRREHGTKPLVSFAADPDAQPSTNVHAITGRNGVGKSTLLRRIVDDLVSGELAPTPDTRGLLNDPLTNVVGVSFSPFDTLHTVLVDPRGNVPFAHVGLHEPASFAFPERDRLKSDEELRAEFVSSWRSCMVGARRERWRAAVGFLAYPGAYFLDPEELDQKLSQASLANRSGLESWVVELFTSLSSGHKIAMLIITRLVQLVTERTLVVIDEPETHLHPPFLAALLRAVSWLMADRNGMALVATHSPVVLQEVPKSCVWVLRRFGDELTAARPRTETYGENVGVLTHEVFGLEVRSSGYYRALAEEVAAGGAFDDITARFSGLGGEGRALLRALIGVRERGES